MGISRENRKKNRFMLRGAMKKNGFDMWRHSFTGYNKLTGEIRSFFIEFYIVNPGVSLKEVSFGSGLLSSQELKPSFFMVKAGSWGKDGKQLHSFFPIGDISINKRKLEIKSNTFVVTENELSGSVEVSFSKASSHPEYLCTSGSMSWNLKMDKKIPFVAKKIKSDTKLHWFAQGAKTIYGGTVVFDGIEYVVVPQKSYGHADKFWGKKLSNPWLWLSSSNLTSLITGQNLNHSCFDIGGVSVVNSKPKGLQLFFTNQNQSYDFSPSGFLKKDKINFNFTQNDEVGHWTVTAENSKFLLDVDIFCKKNDMIFMNYINPDGSAPHKTLWSGGSGSGEIRLYKKINKSLEIVEHARVENCGCEYGEY